MNTRRLAGCVRALVCAALCLACALSSAPFPALAESAGARGVTSTFISVHHLVSWEYPYSPDYFRAPQDAYNHDLARLSMGMAVAAFRDKEHPQAQDDNLIAFWEQMGFEDIETDTYRTDPTPDSIGYGIATLKLEDMTLVALAVCGGSYGAEWASNMTVGDGVLSEGFAAASQKVQAALKDYMERHPAEGVVKLWIAGFSRGGAVANITAADCTDSGAFAGVYGYTFATPRTTRDPGHYANIFNILRKNDTVPRIPLADWGYQRYGTDLFLVSEDTDSDCAPVIERAEALFLEMVGSQMVNNHELNYQLRIVMDYLYMLMQDSATYEKYLQPLLLDILTKDDETMDAVLILVKALQRYSRSDEQHVKDLKALQEFMSTLVEFYYTRDEIKDLPPDQWDPGFGTFNLFNEHFPAKYIAMLFASDDPGEVFSDNTRYIRLVIYGTVDAQIMNGDRVLKTVLSDGTELVDGAEAPDSLPDVDCLEDKTVITLPGDAPFTVSIQSKSNLPQTVTYTGLMFSGNTVRAEADDLYSYLMNPGDTATIITSTGGRAIEPEASDHMDVSAYVGAIYSPTTAMRLETNPVMRLTISGFVNKLIIILLLLVLQMIVSLILTVIRWKTGRKRNALVALLWHLTIAAAFALVEAAMWYFVPIKPLAKVIPSILVAAVIAIYALKGYMERRQRLGAFFILTGLLAAFVALQSLTLGDFAPWKALAIQIVYAGFMVGAYFLMWRARDRREPEQPKAA